MYRIIGADGREYGPVTAETIAAMDARKAASTRRPKCRRKATRSGNRSRHTPELAPAAPAAPASVRRLAAPAGEGQPTIERDRRARLPTSRLASASRAAGLVKANLGILVGGTALVFVLQGVIRRRAPIGRMLVEFGGRSNPRRALYRGGARPDRRVV